MRYSLTSQTRKILGLANEAARSFNHAYVGTEHVLLALVEDGPQVIGELLATFGIDGDKVRTEVEKLVSRGGSPVTSPTLPLTPRAQRAIECAHDEARFMDEPCVGPEQLFLGLMSESTGVACQVLLNLGINPSELRKEVFRVRLAQMKVVERAVRPARVSTLRKRKIREELLAHLSAIYDQEYAVLNDSNAALAAAAKRFGDEAELTRELEHALPWHERLSYLTERFVAYRAPESAARFSFRMAVHTFLVLFTILSVVAFSVFLSFGWIENVKTLARVMAALVVLTPPAQFIVWLTYIKMRDAMWGVFGSRKSMTRALLLDLVIAATMITYILAVAAAAGVGLTSLTAGNPWIWFAAVFAIMALALARLSGPAEIRDTLWALLDVESA
jgi:hypothetical protein